MPLLLGIDFGTDSVRALIVSSDDASVAATATVEYSRWKQGLYCKTEQNTFRQHPQDYLDALTKVIHTCLSTLKESETQNIVAMAIDTTGSSPNFVDKTGLPLALLEHFSEDPDAMTILWKDHSAVAEAEEITEAAHKHTVNYTKYSGGTYSPEWFWAKALHVLRSNKRIAEAAYSFAEHCDWLPFLLCGNKNIHSMRRSRTAAGHKAMWHAEFGGLPSEEFLGSIDPLLRELGQGLYTDTWTSDRVAGRLSDTWAERLHLPPDIVLAVGCLDAHAGVVGAGIQNYDLVRVMGTSTCDMLTAPPEDVASLIVPNICGQVDGSIVPGKIGFEAGQSSFGDLLAWFRNLLTWGSSEDKRNREILSWLERETVSYSLNNKGNNTEGRPLALDWFNGRRSPGANSRLQGALWGLNLGSTAPRVYRSLLEGLACGSRAIVECYLQHGIPVKRIVGVGGVAKKSPALMQILADMLQRSVHVCTSTQPCALGASIFAAVAAGIYPKVETAIERMASSVETIYTPDPGQAARYNNMFKRYSALGKYMESSI